MKNALLQDNIDLLKQTRNVASDITDEIYQAVGSHFRHVLDHYSVFLSGYEKGLVDYDSRERNTKLAYCRERMLNSLEQTIETMEQISCIEVDQDAALRIKCATCAELPEAGEPSVHTATSESTIGRELIFLHSHTIHHIAIISLRLQMQGVAVMSRIGVAPSTRLYEAGVESVQVQAG